MHLSGIRLRNDLSAHAGVGIAEFNSWQIHSMIETQGLTHINLLVADIQRAKKFYETVFG